MVGAVVAVLASGCSDDDPDPKIGPSETVASTPFSSAPTTSPTPDDRGPIEVVRAFISAQNEALLTGDTTAMKELAATNCRGCTDFSEPIEQVYLDGGSFTTDGWTLVRAKVRDASERAVAVDAAVRIAGGTTIVEAGADPVEYEVDHRLMVFKLESRDSEWHISFIGFLS